MKKNANIKIWLTISMLGSFVFSLLWLKDRNFEDRNHHVGIGDIFPGFFYISGVALVGAGIAVLVYIRLRERWLAKYGLRVTQLRLCIVAMLLICLIGFFPFMILTYLTGLGPTVNHGTGHAYDMHSRNLASNMCYFFVSYAIPSILGIFLDKSVPDK